MLDVSQDNKLAMHQRCNTNYEAGSKQKEYGGQGSSLMVFCANYYDTNHFRFYVSFISISLVIGILLILNGDTCFVGPWYKLSPQVSCFVFWMGSALSLVIYVKTTQSSYMKGWGSAICDAIIWCGSLFLMLKSVYLWMLQPAMCFAITFLSIAVGVCSWFYLDRCIASTAVMRRVSKRFFVTIVSCVAIMSLAVGCELFSPMHGVVSDLPEEQKMLQNNIESAALFFDEDQWRSSSLQARIDAMQAIASVESRFLGVNEPRVEFSLLGASTIAGYDRRDNVVRVNIAFKDMEGREALVAVAHEMAHCYEWACLMNTEHMKLVGIELSPEQIDAMRFELQGHYLQSGEGYQNQECERFARYYAQVSLSDIEKRVEKWKCTGDASA